MYIKKLFDWLWLVLVLLVVVGFLAGLRVALTTRPERLGNFESNIARIEKEVDSNKFTFWVAGDIKGGTATFEAMLDAVSGERPAFLIIMGDFVSLPIAMNHKLFALEMKEYCEHIQVFVVPGNHDISPKEFSIEDFRKTYGADEYRFTIGHNLFIFLNDLIGYNDNGEYLAYLEKVLAEYEGKGYRSFVFTHIPPGGVVPNIMCSTPPDNEGFLELIRKYKVDYVFAGDHHGYAKKKVGDTTFIVSGGGGARLRGEKGRFFHITRMDIEGNDVTETVIAGQKKLETAELLEYNIAVHIWPTAAAHPAWTIIILAVVSGLIINGARKKSNRGLKGLKAK
jgi:predicted MPP superfamily phosphohydrolase